MTTCLSLPASNSSRLVAGQTNFTANFTDNQLVDFHGYRSDEPPDDAHRYGPNEPPTDINRYILAKRTARQLSRIPSQQIAGRVSRIPSKRTARQFSQVPTERTTPPSSRITARRISNTGRTNRWATITDTLATSRSRTSLAQAKRTARRLPQIPSDQNTNCRCYCSTTADFPSGAMSSRATREKDSRAATVAGNSRGTRFTQLSSTCVRWMKALRKLSEIGRIFRRL